MNRQMLSMTSDYVATTGCAEPYLRGIADAGFTHVHWCHQWNTDFLYTEPEIEEIVRWFSAYGLKLLDLHASHGMEKNWGSLREYERQAGVALVANRMEMTSRLESDVVVLHLPPFPGETELHEDIWRQVFKSMDELRKATKKNGVRIALENMSFGLGYVERVLGRYGPEFVGLCYDSGHGNLIVDGLDQLQRVKDRLIAVHLHDNDGTKDQHRLPFEGTVDWERLAGILARSSYKKCVSLESNMRGGTYASEKEFLTQGYRAAKRLAKMVEGQR